MMTAGEREMEAREESAGVASAASGVWELAETANNSAAQETTASLYTHLIGLFAERRLERDVAFNWSGWCRNRNLHV
jgi:hypothetical protein